PVVYRPMYGSFGGALHKTSLTFLSRAAVNAGVRERLGLKKNTVAVNRCRRVTKKDMVNNDALPRIEVNPETYEVRADGVLLSCEPADVLPMAQRYFLFLNRGGHGGSHPPGRSPPNVWSSPSASSASQTFRRPHAPSRAIR